MVNPPAGRPPVSTVEDLDPEPAGGRAGAFRWETILGLLLVLGLAGLGAANWWTQQTALSTYQRGRAAAAHQDWDAARVAYLAAGGYGDAAIQAGAAARTIVARDLWYARATAAAAAQDWPAVLQATTALAPIAPRYRDAAALAAQAGPHVLTAALSGTVVLRTAAVPPGLYTYEASGWAWLPDSDASSRLLGLCPDGGLLYDAPASAAPAGPAPLPSALALTARDVARPELLGRRLLRHPPGAAVALPVAFEPARFSSYICTATGVWGIRPGWAPGGGNDSIPLLISPFSLAYQPFGRPRPDSLILPGPQWYLLGIAPAGDRLVVADLSDISLNVETWHTRFYLTPPDGSTFTALADLPGAPAGSDFSPDGRFLLLHLYQPLTLVRGQMLAVLVDLTGATPPRTLVRRPVDAQAAPAPPGPGGVFLRYGPRAGWIVLSPGADPAHLVRLLNPALPAGSRPDAPVDGGALGLRFLSQERAAGPALLGLEIPDAAGGSTVALLWADRAPQVVRLPLTAGSVLVRAWVRAGRLVWAERVATPATPGPPVRLRSLPLGALTGLPPSSTDILVVNPSLPAATGAAPAPAASAHLGPRLLAYLTPGGDLRARGYDGAVDLFLESGVSALANADPGTPAATVP